MVYPVLAHRRKAFLVSGPFQPTDISNCVLWLDASDAATVTESAGEVSDWLDKSGQNNDFAQTTASKKPDNGGSINSLVALNFDGGDSLVGPDDIIGISSENTLTIFIVYKPKDFASSQFVFGGITEGSETRGVLQHRANIAGDKAWFNSFDGSSNGNVEAGDMDAEQAYLLTFMTNASNFRKTRINGGSFSENTQNLGAMGLYDAAVIGANATEGTFCTGEIAEIIIYESGLSDGEIEQVESYLASKWGISTDARGGLALVYFGGDPAGAGSFLGQNAFYSLGVSSTDGTTVADAWLCPADGFTLREWAFNTQSGDADIEHTANIDGAQSLVIEGDAGTGYVDGLSLTVDEDELLAFESTGTDHDDSQCTAVMEAPSS